MSEPRVPVDVRAFTWVGVVVTAIYVLAALAGGYAFVTTDWSALACFDGCAERAGSGSLSDIRVSSWLLASGAVAGMVGAGVRAVRLRTWWHVAVSWLLLVGAVALVTVLSARL